MLRPIEGEVIMLHEKQHAAAAKVRKGVERKTTTPATKPAGLVELPKPKLDGETSVEQAFRARRTVREVSDRELAPQLLSDLLFAACGVNRRRGPFGASGLTAASASNSQEVAIFVALRGGAYLFDPNAHALVPCCADDVRPLAIDAGQRDTAALAPVQLIFVADLHRLEHTSGYEEPGLHDPEVQKAYYYVDTGLIAANVYLFAAAEGLACWFHNCDRAALARALGLGPEQRVLFAQSVGYPLARRGA